MELGGSIVNSSKVKARLWNCADEMDRTHWSAAQAERPPPFYYGGGNRQHGESGRTACYIAAFCIKGHCRPRAHHRCTPAGSNGNRRGTHALWSCSTQA